MGQLDLDFAEKKKEQGMTRSALNADYHNVGWQSKAYDMLRQFLSTHSSSFRTEEARCWAEDKGFVKPPSKRAWGSIIRRAHKNGIVVFVGYAKTTNPQAHRTPAALWRRA